MERPRRTIPRPGRTSKAALGGRGIAIAVLVLVSGTCFALGFFVGKAASKGRVVTEVITIPVEPGEAEKQAIHKAEPAEAGPGKADAAGVPEEPPIFTENSAQSSSMVVKAGTVDESSFSVQVGAFANLQEAEALREKLGRRGYDSYIVLDSTGGSKTLYRVRVGSFDDKGAAKRMVLELKRREGISAFITPGA
jgi:cell division protein FtsN